MGGALSEDCGYKMEPIISFEEVLQKQAKKWFQCFFIKLSGNVNFYIVVYADYME